MSLFKEKFIKGEWVRLPPHTPQVPLVPFRGLAVAFNKSINIVEKFSSKLLFDRV